MNPSTLIGIFASSILLASVLLFTAESPHSFLNLPGLAIVLAGTLAATFISYPLQEVLRVVRLVGLVFRRENTYCRDDIKELVDMSRLWFKGDVRAVEAALEQTRNPFLRTGIQLVIANTKEDEIFDMLRWRIARLKAREHAEAQIFRTMATYAPAFGMIGTLIGLVQMLSNMEDPKSIGPAMAVALLTTLYGAMIATMIATPIADKLSLRMTEEARMQSLYIDALVAIQEGTNPRIIEQMLSSYLPPKEREKVAEAEGA